MSAKPTRSISELAAQEQKNIDKHLEYLGDTYNLTTQLEGLYDTFPPLCRFPMNVETNDAAHAAGINAHLMLVCRRELTVGILIVLRGYRIDSLVHLRKAIELCAYAAKMERHPEMSRTWIQAGTSDESWEKFRDKFKKLFPEDDRELTFLYGLYDEASEAMHSSIKAVADYLIADRRLESVPEIGIFDIRSDAVFVAHFFRAIDCHLTIIQVFQRILKDYVRGAETWLQQLTHAKEAFGEKHQQWLPVIQTAGKSEITG